MAFFNNEQQQQINQVASYSSSPSFDVNMTQILMKGYKVMFTITSSNSIQVKCVDANGRNPLQVTGNSYPDIVSQLYNKILQKEGISHGYITSSSM